VKEKRTGNSKEAVHGNDEKLGQKLGNRCSNTQKELRALWRSQNQGGMIADGGYCTKK
jgi:hypothetical protein